MFTLFQSLCNKLQLILLEVRKLHWNFDKTGSHALSKERIRGNIICQRQNKYRLLTSWKTKECLAVVVIVVYILRYFIWDTSIWSWSSLLFLSEFGIERNATAITCNEFRGENIKQMLFILKLHLLSQFEFNKVQ